MTKYGLRIGTMGCLLAVVPLILTGCPPPSSLCWHRYLGGDGGDDGATAIAAAPGGGYVIAGYVEETHAADDDALLVKIDENGLRQWEFIAGSGDNDLATCVVPAHGGGYIVGGEFGEDGETSVTGFVTKVSEAGAEVWTAHFDSEETDKVVSVDATTDGGYVALLSADYLGDSEVILVKLGAEGAELWRTTVATGAAAIKVVALEDGASAVLSWAFDSEDGENGVFTVAQFGAAGSVGASFTVDGEEAILPRDMARIDGGWLVVGQDGMLAQDAHAAVLRLDNTGQKVWEKSLGAPGRDEARAVHLAQNGDVLVAGTIISENGKPEMYLARLRPDGALLWERAYGEDDEDEAFGIANAPGGGVVIVGQSDSFEDEENEEHYEILVVRTDAKGRCEGVEVALPLASDDTE
ncbi:MAG: hypothetical protein ACLFTT_09460 [Candidatus Hydrogenedentota bacterium]